MRQLRGAKPNPSDTLTPIADFADRWEVDPKTVEKWVEIVYLAFDVTLPKTGMLPDWGCKMLDIVAKHISKKATLYFAETQEQRRLKGVEFVRKIRALRKEGHFTEFEQFRLGQPTPHLNDLNDDEDEGLEILSEMGAIARQQDNELLTIKQEIERREDDQIEEIATFIEQSDQRKMSKLARRLQTRRIPQQTTQDAIDTTFRRLP